MKITNLNNTPIHTIPYKKVIPSRLHVEGVLPLQDHFWPVLEGKVDKLPDELDALIVASDLQGHMEFDGGLKLMGEILPEELKLLIEIEYPNLNIQNVGVMLCGDLFALEHRRGGIGDVRSVYHAFKKHFKWVAGVAGNHDMIGTENSKVKEFQFERDIYYFENGNKTISELSISGVGGIIGPIRKMNRWEEGDFLKAIKKQCLKKPDILLLHEGPDFVENELFGNSCVRETLENSPATLVCFGHRHWETPFHTLSNGTQLLNLEERTVLLIRE
ncbi:MAG: metallophosphoesterase [Saprospiraceae bacterium]